MSACACKNGMCGCSARSRGGLRTATAGVVVADAFRRLVLSFGQNLAAVSNSIPAGRANAVRLQAVLVERNTSGIILEEPLVVGLQVSDDGSNWTDAGSPLELYDPGVAFGSFVGITAAFVRVRADLYITDEGSAVLAVKCHLTRL